MTRKFSQGEEYLRKMSPEDREARRRALWKAGFVLYWCPNCGGLWWPAGGFAWEELPSSFPCGRPCFGEMMRQRQPSGHEQVFMEEEHEQVGMAQTR